MNVFFCGLLMAILPIVIQAFESSINSWIENFSGWIKIRWLLMLFLVYLYVFACILK